MSTLPSASPMTTHAVTHCVAPVSEPSSDVTDLVYMHTMFLLSESLKSPYDSCNHLTTASITRLSPCFGYEKHE